MPFGQPKIDLTGSVLGRLTITGRCEPPRFGSESYLNHTSGWWAWRCECGNVGTSVHSNLVRAKSNVRSCGCLRKELAAIRCRVMNRLGRSRRKRLLIAYEDRFNCAVEFGNCDSQFEVEGCPW